MHEHLVAYHRRLTFTHRVITDSKHCYIEQDATCQVCTYHDQYDYEDWTLPANPFWPRDRFLAHIVHSFGYNLRPTTVYPNAKAMEHHGNAD